MWGLIASWKAQSLDMSRIRMPTFRVASLCCFLYADALLESWGHSELRIDDLSGGHTCCRDVGLYLMKVIGLHTLVHIGFHLRLRHP